jgi:hypothetical protein
MFICHSCGMSSQPCRRAHHVVLETRPKQYGYRVSANRSVGGEKPKDDPGGVGYETVREVLMCSACAGVKEARDASFNVIREAPSEIEAAVQTLTA